MIIDDNKMVALAGPIADATNYGDYLQKNCHLYKYRNGY